MRLVRFHPRRLALVGTLLGTLSVAALRAPAAAPDEGMWLLTQIKRLALEKKGLKIPVSRVYDPSGPALFKASVQLDGGTAEFVSPDGLLLTNHHVAFEAIQSISSEENDYVDNGFLADGRGGERRARGYVCTLTLSVEDVTDQVLGGLPDGASEKERAAYVAKRRQEIVRAAKEKAGVDYHSFSVVEHFNGDLYLLYRRMALRDVRLVYGPPKSIGEFGGDIDNFMWPRHCGDFSLMRAYVAPDGRPAKYSKENVPYHPEVWLKISTAGVRDGDFTFVIGHPGRTMRQRTSFSMRYHRDQMLPGQIRMIRARIAQLEKASERSEGARLANIGQIKGLNNALKNFVGKVEGFQRYKIVEKEEAEERALMAWMKRHPEAAQKYSGLFDDLRSVYALITSRAAISAALRHQRSSELFKLANRLVELGLEKAKPDEQRKLRYREDRIGRLEEESRKAQEKLDREEQTEKLVGALVAFADLPDAALPGALRKILSGKEGDARRGALEKLARRVAKKTKLFDAETRMGWLHLDARELQTLDDPMMQLARSFFSYAKKATSSAGTNLELAALRRRYYEARQARHKHLEYPDANSTMRLSYGYVKGYKPRDAVWYEPQTTLGGVIEKETGKVPFASPPKLLELYRKRDFGRWADKKLGDVPVAFTHTVDVTGGNSGSPVLNARGELVGIVFDGNYESMTADYHFIPELNRTISVDIRYVLFILDKFAGARDALAELGVKP